MALNIEVLKSESGKCRIELKGRLDTHTAEQLDEKLEALDPASHPLQIVDLADLEYISSAGLRSLFRAKKKLSGVGGQFLVVHPQPQVQKVFDVVKALPSESVFTSQAELDNYLDAIQRKARQAVD
ncbi:MAG: STAS domain-containing protein [Candidatus Eremiobacteraeota bacterium]|nr:STAS domain-containing protein [Candidatus Eremiobacteraeota bacterium]MCW5870018.1 STAS domain-containing protein [Candidatus Eremiobacteraeota bacterium]